MTQAVVYIISCPFVWLLATSQNVPCVQPVTNWFIFGVDLESGSRSTFKTGCDSKMNWWIIFTVLCVTAVTQLKTSRKEKKSVNRILSKKPIFHFLYKSLDNPSKLYSYHWSEWSTASALLTWLMLHFEATFMLKWCSFGEQQISNFRYNWGFSWLWRI